MSTVSAVRPPPTQAQVALLRVLASRVHYAFATRPPRDSPIRPNWDDLFLADVIPLLTVLNSAAFLSVPSLAMGCVWVNNSRFLQDPPCETLDIEAIGPVVEGHPALAEDIPRGMKRLKYTATDDGPDGLLPEGDLENCWWTAYRGGARPPRKSGGASFEDASDHRSLPADHQSEARQRDPSPTSIAPSPQAVEESEDAIGEDSMMSVDIEPEPLPVNDAPPRHDSAQAAALAQVYEEVIPIEWLEHPRPCLRCAKTGIKCYIYPTTSSVCGYCAKRKQKCTLTFNITDRTFAGFLAWAYFIMLCRPEVFGEPPIRPPDIPSGISEAPEWFQRQCVGTSDRPPYPNVGTGGTTALSPDLPPEPPLPPTESSHTAAESGPSTRSSKGKSVAGRNSVTGSRAPSAAPSLTEDRGRAEMRPSRASARATRASSAKKANSAPGHASPNSATHPPPPKAAFLPGSLTASARPMEDSAPTSSNQTPSARKLRAQLPARRPEALGLVPSSSKSKTAAGNSKRAPIDVDAMDLDEAPRQKRKSGIPIPTDHLGPPVTVRGSEFDYASVGDRDRHDTSPGRSPSPDEVRDATVPPIVGSWKNLPRFNDLQPGIGGAQPLRPAPSEMRLSTPPTLSSLPDIGSINKEAAPATEQLRAILDIMTGAYESTRDHAASLERQAIRMRSRSAATQSNAVGRSGADAVDIWLPEVHTLGEDLQSITTQLASAEKWISILAGSFRDFLSFPLEGDVLNAMLGEVCKIKDAYKDACEVFAQLQEDVRPLRREIYLLRGRADSAEAVAEAAATEAAYAVEPLLAKLHTLILAEIQAVQLSVLAPMERLAETVASQGALAPDVLGDIVQGLRAALGDMWKSASSIHCFVMELWQNSSAALEARVHALEVRIGQMEGSGGATNIKNIDSSAGPMERLSNAVDSLADRVHTLEIQAARRDELEKQVLDVLARVGLTPEVICRLTQ